ncbi:MAG: hypothetical protein JWQ71_3019 [Pedosphaera sp.]|nr:hypothetical protein [Pedosphaera sp.]
MLYTLWGLLFLFATASAMLMLRRTRRRRQHDQALALIKTTRCRHCDQAYGANLRDYLIIGEYMWKPAKGHTVSSLKLPAETYHVKCPHCGEEVELTREGKPFQHPQTGILGFTRTGFLRTPKSI